MIRRVIKMLGALGAGTGATALSQLLLPPVFLHSYGVRLYGEWLVLAGTVSYLAALNLGVTTYASNRLTMLRERGELAEFRRLQGSSLALLLCMMCLGVIVTALVFVVRPGRLLHLSVLAENEVDRTAFLLGMQVLAGVVAGYYSGLFMVVKQAHRGMSWAVARALGATLVCFALATMRAPFHTLALGQLLTVVLITWLSIVDLKRVFADLPLGLGGAEWSTMKRTLRPSGMFALVFAQQVLTFQAPVNLLQWVLGPAAVVMFTTCRTLLSTARQVLSPITNAVGPEITFSYAAGDRAKMLSIFHGSERIVFAGIPIANLGVFLFAPLLLRLWLHRPELFNLGTYALMTLISAAMSVRDHKQFFQFSTNVHHRLAGIVVGASAMMIALGLPVTRVWGLNGFLLVWLLSECVQLALIFRENRRLFGDDASITLAPVFRLIVVLAVGLPACMFMIRFGSTAGIATATAMDGLALAVLALGCGWTFGMKDLWAAFRDEWGWGKTAGDHGQA